MELNARVPFWETRGALLPSRDIVMWMGGLWLGEASSREGMSL